PPGKEKTATYRQKKILTTQRKAQLKKAFYGICISTYSVHSASVSPFIFSNDIHNFILSQAKIQYCSRALESA
ncbi:MAG: hypothetical protein II568_05225, partial [Erysipelotrichaceae bacterium]|nr:hypothetical protein [Erysipelotrichaceae bacterium]